MNKSVEFTNQDVEIIEKTPLYQGFFRMMQYRFRHKLFGGGWSDTVQREMFERGHAVAVLLYDPHLQEFVLIEQCRIGAMATSDSPWLMEVVAGIIDDGEEAEQVCRREAMEEAGVEIGQLTKALSYLSSPGGTTERLHVYVGEVDASKAQGIHGLDYESEDILVHRVEEAEAMAWLKTGKIDNAAAVIALQWFALNKQAVLNDWHTASQSQT